MNGIHFGAGTRKKPMPRGKTAASRRFFIPKGWRRNVPFTLAIPVVLLGAAYAMRCTLLLNIARVVLSRDADLLAQERKDGVTISFASTPSAWVKPMKNLMNPIWLPLHAEGVNYFTFAAPGNLLRSFSERSNPRSPYYQAWVGGYVTKRSDGTLPADLPMWASKVTALDQRSWLSAMGDPMSVADFGAAQPVGNITVDHRDLQLWHGAMQSHSDLSDRPRGPLATLLGMPPKSTWPNGVQAFHDVTLDGYFVCWSDPKLRISVVIYAVAADVETPSGVISDNRRIIKNDLLNLIKSARIEPVI
jgi:hypothetical protein